jgi:hypothetical protein
MGTSFLCVRCDAGLLLSSNMEHHIDVQQIIENNFLSLSCRCDSKPSTMSNN